MLKKWFVTFSTENPGNIGFAIIFAENANVAQSILRTLGTSFNNKNTKVLEIIDLECTPCTERRIVTEGVCSSGATYIPKVSKDGILSWENNEFLPNPKAVNIKGPKGDPGKSLTFEDLTSLQINQLRGKDGNDGKSAFELWKEYHPDSTIDDFFLSLIGPKGDMGVTYKVMSQLKYDNLSLKDSKVFYYIIEDEDDDFEDDNIEEEEKNPEKEPEEISIWSFGKSFPIKFKETIKNYKFGEYFPLTFKN